MIRPVKIVLAILLLAGIAAGGVGAWMLWLSFEKDASLRHAAALIRARTLAEHRQFQEAVVAYYDVLGVTTETRERVSILFELAKVYRAQPCEDMARIVAQLHLVQGIYERILALDSGNIRARRLLLDDTRTFAETARYRAGWEMLLKVAHAHLAMHPDDPQARFCRGLAQTALVGKLEIKDRIRAAAREDFEAVLAVHANQPEAAYHLACWHLDEARLLAEIGDRDNAAHHRQRAGELMGAARDAAREDVHLRTYYALYLEQRMSVAATSDSRPELARVLAELEAQLRTAPVPKLAGRVAQLLAADPGNEAGGMAKDNASGLSGFERAERLLNRTLEETPQSCETQLELARLLHAHGRIDAALACYEQFAEVPPMSASLAHFAEFFVRFQALAERAGLLLATYEELPEGDARDRTLAMSESLVEPLRTWGRDLPFTELIQGRVHCARGRHLEAVMTLHDAMQRLDRRHWEARYFLAMSLARLGEHGAAARLIDELLKNAAIGTTAARRLLLERGNILLRQQRIGDALGLARTLVTQYPADAASAGLLRRAAGARIMALWHADPDTARRELAALLPTLEADAQRGNIDDIELLAHLNELAGHRERAQDWLRRAFEINPANAAIAARLVGGEWRLGRTETARELTDRALAAGLPETEHAEVRALLAAAGQDASTSTEILRAALIPDPVKRALACRDLHWRRGDVAAAKAALDRAAAAAPRALETITARLRHALDGGDLEDMRTIMRAEVLLGTHPWHLGFWDAQIKLAEGQPQQAVTLLTRLLRLFDISSDAWTVLGRAQAGTADAAAAESSFRRALDIRPDHPDALSHLFTLLDARAAHDEALDILRRLVAATGANPAVSEQWLLYMERHGSLAETADIRRRLAMLHPDDAQNRRKLALLEARLGRIAEAVAALEALLEQHAETFANVLALAEVRHIAGAHADGVALLRAFVERQGDAARPEQWLALARFEVETAPDAAIHAYGQAARGTGPDAMAAVLELAALQRRRNRLDLAIAILDDARKRTNHVEVWGHYVACLLEQGLTDQADHELTAMLAQTPATVASLLLKARIAEIQQRLGDAMAALDAAVTLAAEATPEPYRARAVFLLRNPSMARHDVQAKLDLEHALKLNPEVHDTRKLLVGWHLARHDHRGAAEQLRQILAGNPQDLEARRMRALILLQSGDYDELKTFLDDCEARIADSELWPWLRSMLFQQQRQPLNALLAADSAVRRKVTEQTLANFVQLLLDAGQARRAVEQLGQADDAMLAASPVLRALRLRGLLARAGETAPVPAEEWGALLAETADDTQVLGFIVTQASAVLAPDAVAVELARATTARATPALRLVAARQQFAAGNHEAALKLAAPLETELAAGHPLLAEALEALGSVHVALADSTAARRVYQKLVDLRPNSAEATIGLARALLLAPAVPRRVIDLCGKGLALSNMPEVRARMLHLLGQAHLQLAHSIEAQTALQRSLQLADSPTARLHLSMALAADQKLAAARDERERATDDAFARRDIATLEWMIDELRGHDPAATGQIRLARAECLLETGAVDDACSELARPELPNSTRTHLLRALCLAAKGEEAEAHRKLVERTRNAKPGEKSGAFLALARFLRHTGQADAALANYRKAMDASNTNRMSMALELGRWLEASNRLEDAAEIYDLTAVWHTGVELSQRVVEVNMRLGRAGRATEHLRTVLSATPDNGELRLLEARVAAAQGDMGRVATASDLAARLMPGDARPYVLRAEATLGSDAGASTFVKWDLEKALNLQPNGERPLELLTDWYLRQGMTGPAADTLSRLIRLAPAAVSARSRLIHVHIERGALAAARELLRESDLVLPDRPEWHDARATLLAREGRTAESLEERRIHFAMTKTPDALCRLLEALLAADQEDDVDTLLNDAAAPWTDHPEIRALHMRLLARHGQFDAALAQMRHALDAATEPGQVQNVARHVALAFTMSDLLRTQATWSIWLPPAVLRLVLQHMTRRTECTPADLADLRQLDSVLPSDSALRTPVLEHMGVAAYRLEQFEAAQTAYETLLRLEPDSILALNNLADLLAERKGLAVEALAMAERAVHLAGGKPHEEAACLDTLGAIQMRLRLFGVAEQNLKRSLRIREMPATHLRLAELHLAQGTHDKAVGELARARALAEATGDTAMLERIAAVSERLGHQP